MSLRVVGAGLPRTGTRSLKLALERLLGEPCYHMHEVFENLDHVPAWRGALAGDPPDWSSFPAGYASAVDWPASAFWQELAEANPGAVILLSLRESAEQWWRSADQTILPYIRRPPDAGREDWHALVHGLLQARIAPGWDDADVAMAAYKRHNEHVRASAPRDRLVVWRPEDGWAPLCWALDLPVPDEPFPRLNTTEEWLQQAEQ